MINPALEKRASNCKEILKQWRRFRDLFRVAVSKEEEIKPAHEAEFLQVKSKIAMLFDSYLDCIKSGQKIAQNVMQVVSRSITLKHVSELSLAESKKFEIEWHEAFLQMEETIAQLDEERQRLLSVSPATYARRRMIKNSGDFIKGVFKSPFFKLVLVLAVVIGLFGGGLYFNVHEKLYENESTRSIAVGIFKLIRTFNPDYPYRDLVVEEMIPNALPRNKPSGWSGVEDRTGRIQKSDAVAQFVLRAGNQTFNQTQALMQAQEHGVSQVAGQRGTNFQVDIVVLRMGTVDEAKAIESQYQTFVANANVSPEDTDQDINLKPVIRRANLLILVSSPDKTAREDALNRYFG